MTRHNFSDRSHIATATSAGLLLLILSACSTLNNTPPPKPLTSHQGPEKIFATPEQASDALADASRANDKKELLKILGPDGVKIINSGDAVSDKEGRERFAAAYDKAHRIETDIDGKDVLIVGDEDWPLPIPLVAISKKNAVVGWQFDTKAGEEEILNRRIGRNELNVIKVTRAFVEAEHDYGSLNHTADGRAEYARRFISSKGKHDGLYWPVTDGEEESPLGPLVASAQAENPEIGKHHLKPVPYHGYYYRILMGQGPNAAGGSKKYIVNGHMTKGFALVAFPAKYGDSGIMTFIVNQNGIVYERNLGPDTHNLANAMTLYDPDQNWHIATDQY